MYIPSQIVETLHEERLKELGYNQSKERYQRVSRFSLWSHLKREKKKKHGIVYRRITMSLWRFYLKARVLVSQCFPPVPTQPTCPEESYRQGANTKHAEC